MLAPDVDGYARWTKDCGHDIFPAHLIKEVHMNNLVSRYQAAHAAHKTLYPAYILVVLFAAFVVSILLGASSVFVRTDLPPQVGVVDLLLLAALGCVPLMAFAQHRALNRAIRFFDGLNAEQLQQLKSSQMVFGDEAIWLDRIHQEKQSKS